MLTELSGRTVGGRYDLLALLGSGGMGAVVPRTRSRARRRDRDQDHAEPSNRRRISFLTQVVAEAAGLVGDADTCIDMVMASVRSDLYDLHWLERCPLLDSVRGYRTFSNATEIVRERAEAIVDAMYGDSSDSPAGERTVIA